MNGRLFTKLPHRSGVNGTLTAVSVRLTMAQDVRRDHGRPVAPPITKLIIDAMVHGSGCEECSVIKAHAPLRPQDPSHPFQTLPRSSREASSNIGRHICIELQLNHRF